ncbi:MAG: hypothetical protein E7Z64_00380 [Thermoplasmata archaeon]|nr:hypothetical protein [Thermoplasmata archaeon]
MKFSIARLCGGQALMAVSVDIMDIDMEAAAKKIEAEGLNIKSKDDQMIVYDWNNMETTLYRPGKVMFFPLSDKATCIKYATEILEQYL